MQAFKQSNARLVWKMSMEIEQEYLSGGTVHGTPLIKNENAVDAMDSPRDDGGLASPRRGEAKRIGELYPFKI